MLMRCVCFVLIVGIIFLPVNVMAKDDGGLLKAINSRNLEMVRESIHSGADVNATARTGLPYLYNAMRNKRVAIVECLLTNGADPNAVDPDGISMLMYAAGAEGAGVVYTDVIGVEHCQLLLKYGASVNDLDKEGYSALDYAIKCGLGYDQAIIDLLLANGAVVSQNTVRHALEIVDKPYFEFDFIKQIISLADSNVAQNSVIKPLFKSMLAEEYDSIIHLLEVQQFSQQDKVDLLFFAAADGALDIIKLLVDQGISPDQRRWNGRTPLMEAAKYGKVDAVEYLLSRSVDINAQDFDGNTALSRATKNGEYEVAVMLIKNGAATRYHTMDREKPERDVVFDAISGGHLNLVKLLLVDYPSGKKDYARDMLIETVRNGHVEILQFLLEEYNMYADQELLSELLQYACGWGIQGRFAIAELLIERGANVDGFESNGYPLSSACMNGDLHMVQFLVENGTDVNASSESARLHSLTAMDEAIASGYFDIVRFMVENGYYVDASYVEKAGQQGSINIYEYLKSHELSS